MFVCSAFSKYLLTFSKVSKFTAIHRSASIKSCFHVPLRCVCTSRVSQRRNVSARIREPRIQDVELPSSSTVPKSTCPSPLPPDPSPQLKEAKRLDTNDELLTRIVRSLKQKKIRDEKNEILLKGENLIKVAVSKGVQLKYLFYSKEEALWALGPVQLSSEKVLKVKGRTLRDLLGREIDAEIVGICSKPLIEEDTSSIPVTVLCTNIREPSNLGNIISIAAAVGCKSVLLFKGCADAWEYKVLSSANGGHFYIPIINIDWTNIMDFLPENASFYIADGSADIDLDDSHIHSDVVCGEITGEVTQINFLESKDVEEVDKLTSDKVQIQEYVEPEVPCHLFCSVSFPKKDIIVYIGGETHGIDPKIEQLSLEFNSKKLKIPLENGMDSLNVCSALSIVLFEIQRQLSKHSHSQESV